MPNGTFAVIFFDLGDTLVTRRPGAQRFVWLPGAQQTLVQLQAAGFRLGLISNTDNLTRDQLLDRLPQDFDLNIFEADLVILSSEAGIEKPSPGIFQQAAAKANLPPGECLFCTETLLDTLAAQEVGMHVVRLCPPPASDIADLPDELNKLTALTS